MTLYASLIVHATLIASLPTNVHVMLYARLIVHARLITSIPTTVHLQLLPLTSYAMPPDVPRMLLLLPSLLPPPPPRELPMLRTLSMLILTLPLPTLPYGMMLSMSMLFMVRL